MTREERAKLIKHLKYNRSIGADYLITDKDADEIIKALEQEECEKVVPMSVIEDIKAEIEQRKKDTLSYKDNNAETGCEFWDFALGLQEAMAIIDKHISGKGGE